MLCTSTVRRAGWAGQRAFSSATAWRTAAWKRASSESSAAGSTERMSTSMLASAAMAFTEVPPCTTPTLKVTLGSAGTWKSAILAMARPRACVGLGMPKSP